MLSPCKSAAWLAGSKSVSYSAIASVVVLCMPPKNQVVAGMLIFFFSKAVRTAESLSSAASARALTSPVWPPQAPQSNPAACGLLAVWLPWPASSTTRAKSWVTPMALRMPAAMSARDCSSASGVAPDRFCKRGLLALISSLDKPVCSTVCGLPRLSSVFLSSLPAYSSPQVSTKLKPLLAVLEKFCQALRQCKPCLRRWAIAWPRDSESHSSVTHRLDAKRPGSCGRVMAVPVGEYEMNNPKNPAKPRV